MLPARPPRPADADVNAIYRDMWRDMESMETYNKLNELCVRCGQVATGFAFVDGKRHCAGAWVQPTCFEKATAEL